MRRRSSHAPFFCRYCLRGSFDLNLYLCFFFIRNLTLLEDERLWSSIDDSIAALVLAGLIVCLLAGVARAFTAHISYHLDSVAFLSRSNGTYPSSTGFIWSKSALPESRDA